MKGKTDPKEWANEFKDFMETSEISVPRQVQDKIISRVHSDLNPSSLKVFRKIALIHVVVGVVSLLMCPQFGVSPLGNMGLMALLMRFSDTVCMIGCGAIFVGGTALVSSFALRPEEIRILRKTEALQFAVLGILSIGTFLCVGASVAFGLGLAWLAGSLVGGLLSLEIGWAIRKKVAFA